METTDDLKLQWQQYREQNPGARIRNAADALGVSEAALLATDVGEHVIRLDDHFGDLVVDVERLGSVMALTRNDHVVHERHGVYQSPELIDGHARMGLVVGDDIDLRIFFRRWHLGFAVAEQTRHGERKSLQFFDRDGTAVHKIYITKKSNTAAYEALVEKYRAKDQCTALSLREVGSRRFERCDGDIDVTELRSSWAALKDTHDFFPLLRRLKVDREQALRLAGSQWARPIAQNAAREVLTKAADMGLPIMVFVGSPGVVQIHSGTVEQLKTVGDWFNVLDPDFNLHLRESGVASAWLVRKPTEDGVVTSVECYDDRGELVVQFFGLRKPGIAEDTRWRELAESLDREGQGVAP